MQPHLNTAVILSVAARCQQEVLQIMKARTNDQQAVQHYDLPNDWQAVQHYWKGDPLLA